jgi:curved DNA-binding protein CbpA
MSEATGDPYAILGVTPTVTDAELRRVYRDLVKRHHPDHNGGSPESARHFAQIQDAYVRVARLRNQDHEPSLREQARASDDDPGINERIADLERELAATRDAQARAAAKQQAARQAASRSGAYQQPKKPTREELGYYETDDSFSKILDDAGSQAAERLDGARRSDFTKRLTDLFRGGERE